MSGPSFPTPTSPLYALACDWVRLANNRDYAGLEALLADDFTNQLHPKTIRTPGHEERVDKTAFIERTKQLLGEEGFVKELNVSLG